MWSALIDLLWYVVFSKEIGNLVAVSGVMLVYEVEGVPLVEVALIIAALRSSEGMELLIKHIIEVNFDSVVETFLLHPLATIAVEVDLFVTSNFFQVAHDLRTNQIRLSGVGQNAHILSAESSIK